MRSAAEHQLEIIGEAAGKLSDQLQARRPDLPISEARGLRNVIAHEYGDVDYDLLWHTMSASVPQFADSLGTELAVRPTDVAETEAQTSSPDRSREFVSGWGERVFV